MALRPFGFRPPSSPKPPVTSVAPTPAAPAAEDDLDVLFGFDASMSAPPSSEALATLEEEPPEADHEAPEGTPVSEFLRELEDEFGL